MYLSEMVFNNMCHGEKLQQRYSFGRFVVSDILKHGGDVLKFAGMYKFII